MATKLDFQRETVIAEFQAMSEIVHQLAGDTYFHSDGHFPALDLAIEGTNANMFTDIQDLVAEGFSLTTATSATVEANYKMFFYMGYHMAKRGIELTKCDEKHHQTNPKAN